MLRIVDADSGENLEQVRVLFGEFGCVLKEYFCEYRDRPDFKEYFDNYEHEIAHVRRMCRTEGLGRGHL
jgi:hypothetical protein